ncbi:MAG: hypothetical protein J5569_03745 [Oscillospiraceae bacterium]|nr:hypothetical protein [Oscillospiraceae bacterium]
MGASQEKRRRQEAAKDGGFGKVTRAQEEAAKAKKTRRNTIIVIVVVLVCLAAALFVNSGYLRRNGTALRIGDSKISVADYNYFFNNTYYDYRSDITTYYPDYADTLLPKTTEPLSSQKYSDDMTWQDYFENLTLNKMVPYYTAYEAAKAAGYQLSESGKSNIEAQIEAIRSAASQSTFANIDDYLTAYYGRGMTADVFRKCAGIVLTASEYSESYKNSLTYTADQIADKKADGSYDQYSFRRFTVISDTINEENFTGDADAYNAAVSAVNAIAKQEAEAICKDIKSEEDFIAAASEYDSTTYGAEDSTFVSVLSSDLTGTYADWVRDGARKAGDTAVIEGDNGYDVLYFLEHSANDYNTIDVRVIGITPDSVDSSKYDDDEEYHKAVDEALKAAEEKATALYEEWKSGDATEESFIEYANTESVLSLDDGLAEYIHKGELDAAMEEWCFSADRKPGDTTVIASESSNCVYILWYVGENDVYSDYLAETDLRSADYSTWYSGLTEGVEPQKAWLFRLTK